MRCPFATYKPVSSHGGPIESYLGVVIHVTAGEGDPYNEFDNPANQVSSHFGIGNGQGGMADGALEQYLDTADQSWAQVEGNASYISVETEGVPTDPLTPAQIATFARLYAWLNEVHGVPFSITDTPGDPGFITHGDGGVAWGDHIDCPGPLRSPQRAVILAAADPSHPAPEEQVQRIIFEADVLINGQAKTALFISDGTWFRWIASLPDTEAVATAASGGQAPVEWTPGEVVADPGAFGCPQNAETADMLGIAFP